MALGPAFSFGDLVAVALFVANYALVAPASVACVIVGVARRRRARPLWLIPVACVNLLVAVPQLVLLGAENERWLSALLVAQSVAAVAVIVWASRARVG